MARINRGMERGRDTLYTYKYTDENRVVENRIRDQSDTHQEPIKTTQIIRSIAPTERSILAPAPERTKSQSTLYLSV